MHAVSRKAIAVHQQLFSLTAQVLGHQRSCTAESDGFGITVNTATGPRSVRSWHEAIRVAEQDIGLFLRRAERGDIPWGLHVSVGTVQAVYGEWPLLPGPPSDRPEPSPVSRIRSRWRESDGPMSALNNAVEIIRFYLPRRRQAA